MVVRRPARRSAAARSKHNRMMGLFGNAPLPKSTWDLWGNESSPPCLDSGHLSWRMPPEESLSDWTIEISTATADESATTTSDDDDCEEKKQQQTLTTTTFHVHKTALAVGPKCAEYFQRLFQNQNFAESETKTSKIQLNAAAAGAFPCMLDYLYSSQHKLVITTGNATALHFLGQYFECHRLRWEAIHFCRRDLSIHNSATYYEQAQLFHDDKISQLVAEKCCDKLAEIGLDSHLMKVSNVELWRNVIQLIRFGRSGHFYDSKYLSRLIAKFCSTHNDLVDAEIFTHLTDSTHMMVIDEEAAVPLLQMEGLFVPESKTREGLSCLQSRCTGAITSSWEGIDVPSLQHDLSGLNPILMTCVLSTALAEAKLKLKKSEESLHLTEKQLINKVAVMGAGIFEVNGTYTRTPEFRNGAPVFAMNGMYRGSNVVFELFLAETQNGAASEWYLATGMSNNARYLFYFAPHTKGTKWLMPETLGWKMSRGTFLGNGAINPAPTLTFLPEDSSN